jgi:hypothetical protein
VTATAAASLPRPPPVPVLAAVPVARLCLSSSAARPLPARRPSVRPGHRRPKSTPASSDRPPARSRSARSDRRYSRYSVRSPARPASVPPRIASCPDRRSCPWNGSPGLGPAPDRLLPGSASCPDRPPAPGSSPARIGLLPGSRQLVSAARQLALPVVRSRPPRQLFSVP